MNCLLNSLDQLDKSPYLNDHCGLFSGQRAMKNRQHSFTSLPQGGAAEGAEEVKIGHEIQSYDVNSTAALFFLFFFYVQMLFFSNIRRRAS